MRKQFETRQLRQDRPFFLRSMSVAASTILFLISSPSACYSYEGGGGGGGNVQPLWTPPIVALDFDKNYEIDDSKFSIWNGRTNLYFNLNHRLNGVVQSNRMVVEPGSNFSVDLNYDWQFRKDSIRFKLSPYSDGCKYLDPRPQCKIHHKDKIQLSVLDFRDPESLRVDDQKSRFVTFDFKLDKDYEVGQAPSGPKPWVLHFQAWQCCSTPPPFSVVVEPILPGADPRAADVNLVFLVRDDTSTGFPEYKRNAEACAQDRSKCKSDQPFYAWGKVIYRMKMPRDKWGRFTFELKPSFNGDGKSGLISFWFNGVQKFQYEGEWGYKPQMNTELQKFYQPSASLAAEWAAKGYPRMLGVELDIYRGPYQTSTQIVEFSKVRYGNTLRSVLP